MNPHLEPWTITPDDFPGESFASDQLEFLLGYAILAPSTHNAQPWRFRINAMDVELFADRRRALRIVDPQDRELTLGCGAALFNLRIAAEYFGHVYQIEPLPDLAQPDLLARFHLGLSGETSSDDVLIFHALATRHTNRQPFRNEPIAPEILEDLKAAADREGGLLQVIEGDDLRSKLADLVAEGDRLQWADRAFREELARWVRVKPGHDPDGLPVHDLGIKDWLSFAGPSLIRSFDRGNGQAAKDRDIALHSPALAVLWTTRDEPLHWLYAGQALQSVLLHARTNEVSASFLNQPVEVPALRQRLIDLLGVAGFPQTILRLGCGPEAPPTPRRRVHDLIIPHQTTHS